jgi:hypothetical protein
MQWNSRRDSGSVMKMVARQVTHQGSIPLESQISGWG